MGPWSIIGSQEAPLTQSITQSRAGGAAVLQLPTAQGDQARIECESTPTPVPLMTDALVKLGRAMADAHPASKR